MSATRNNRASDEPDPLDSIIGLINASLLAFLIWGLLYLLVRAW
ncbi:hypothetical protein [Marininema mesophilum]|nr:hypothetical protein [Marininema mesophilum]